MKQCLMAVGVNDEVHGADTYAPARLPGPLTLLLCRRSTAGGVSSDSAPPGGARRLRGNGRRAACLTTGGGRGTYEGLSAQRADDTPAGNGSAGSVRLRSPQALRRAFAKATADRQAQGRQGGPPEGKTTKRTQFCVGRRVKSIFEKPKTNPIFVGCWIFWIRLRDNLLEEKVC
jgi:hypothetical protein